MIAIKYYFIKQSGAAHLFRNLFDEEETASNKISAMDDAMLMTWPIPIIFHGDEYFELMTDQR